MEVCAEVPFSRCIDEDRAALLLLQQICDGNTGVQMFLSVQVNTIIQILANRGILLKHLQL